jgi:excisionase family DNA binding protein
VNLEKFTVGKAAGYLGCHPETVRRLERKGTLKGKRDYRGFRIFDLEELLKLKKLRDRLT